MARAAMLADSPFVNQFSEMCRVQTAKNLNWSYRTALFNIHIFYDAGVVQKSHGMRLNCNKDKFNPVFC